MARDAVAGRAPGARCDRPVVVLRARDVGPAASLVDPFDRLRRGPYPWLLDSAAPDGHLGRFSFAGTDPWAVLRAWGREVELDVRRAVHPEWPVGRHRVGDDVFEALRRLVPADATGDFGASDAIPFLGGAVGYLGYELVEQLEPVRLAAREGAPFADATFLLVDTLLAYDHAAGRLWHCGVGFGTDAFAARASAEARLEALARAPVTSPERNRADAPGGPFATRARKRHDAGSYGALVEVVKEAIAEGELYQACLTHRIETDFLGDPWRLYQRLRLRNPAPFAAYLDLPEGTILSSSPERFLRVDGDGRIEARPMKGTSYIAPSPHAAASSQRALAESDKDRAENVMIVDLVRNDLSRVCADGSVRVPVLCALETLPTVTHLVSTVTGTLRPDADALSAVEAAFPGGSVTGAPKLRAMEIIAELEPTHRGPYTGSFGWIGFDGALDLDIGIRTVLVAGGQAHVQVGGAVVLDSEPAAEWRETLDKAEGLLAALLDTPSPRHAEPV